jgi:hypothetical protein
MSTPAPGPSQAGIYDYLLAGDQHTPADRAAAEQAMVAMPQIRLAARENRAFLQRAVRYAARHGVRQYLDIGSGFPAAGPVHEVAAEVIADPHVVYVDHDPGRQGAGIRTPARAQSSRSRANATAAPPV